MLIFMLFVFAGCQNGETSKEPAKQEEAVLTPEVMTWETAAGNPEDISSVCVQDNIMYGIGREDNIEYIYKMDMDGTNQERIEIGNTTFDTVWQMSTDGNGTYRMFVSEYYFTSASACENRYLYLEWEETEGTLEETARWQFDDLDDSETIQGGTLDWNRCAIILSSGKVMIYSNDSMTKAAKKDSVEKYKKSKAKPEKITLDCKEASRVMMDGEDVWISDERSLQKWSIAEKKKLLELELDTSDAVRFLVHPEGKDTLYFMSSDGIFEYKEGGEPKLVLDWLEQNIEPTGLCSLAGNGEVFFAATRNRMNLYLIEKKIPSAKKEETEEEDQDSMDDREVVEVATTDTAANVTVLISQINDFNNSQEDYRVKLEAYGKYENPEEQMRLDIISGSGPDVILITTETENILDQLDQKNGLEDLYPYMEKDEDISKDDFVQKPLELLEYNGKLTRLAQDFSIHCMIGKTDFIGDRTSWTWEEFAACCEKVPAKKAPYLDSYNIFLQAFPSIYGQFFDLQNGTLLSKEGELLNDITLSDKVYADRNWTKETFNSKFQEMIDKLQEGEFYVGNYDNPGMPFRLAKYGYTGKKQELKLIGYPCETGSGVSMSFGNTYAISSFSEHKDGAWQFLKSIFGKGKNNYNIDGTFPLRKDYYEINKKSMLAKEDYVDENGVKIIALGAANGYNITQEDIDEVERIIEMADCRTLAGNHPVREIVEEEMSTYYGEPDRSLEETADYIENRVTLYLSETS
jgi:ABC-type glycerol-3-phosphate transport system substrate-binding protein